jgi:hypothetical protein
VVISLDTDSEAQAKAEAAARSHGVHDRLWPVLGSVAAFFAANPGFAPSLAFLDGDHSYDGVSRDLDTLFICQPVRCSASTITSIPETRAPTAPTSTFAGLHPRAR